MVEEKNDKPRVNPEADIQERVAELQKEMSPLLGKYEIGLGARARVNDDGTLGAEILFVSTRSLPKEKQPDLAEG